MSRTIRRNQFNKKNKFYKHYWDVYSHKEVLTLKYTPIWKYHSDNYHNKCFKDNKQFFKNKMDRKIRRESKLKLHKMNNDIILNIHKKYCIKYMVD